VRRALWAVAALAAAGAAHSAVNARLMRRPGGPESTVDGRVSVLLPLRDEAGRAAPCLRALLAQTGVADLEILVLDDRSTDSTAALVRAVAGADPRVRLLAGTDPPPGWLGKPHACRQLAAHATGDVLVFTDADVVLAPHAVAAAVALLRTSGLGLVSPYPRQVTETAAERIVQPLLQWSWLTFLPLRAAECSPRPSLAAANGQFLAVRREVYDKAGGHAPGAVLDDVELLRAVKRSGGSGVVVDGTTLASCRMYTGWDEVRDGYSKSLWAAFGSPGGAAAAVGVLGVLYVVPVAAALCGSPAGLAGYAAGVAGRVIAARATGGRAWPDALAHPVSVAALGWLTLRSFQLRSRGQLSWKGRPVR
jgi:hypothetical protein